jgi:hypothetical protein
MGNNDHMADKSQMNRRRLLQGNATQMHWCDASPQVIHNLLSVVSAGGGYLGFGINKDGSALLLYIKTDKLNERVVLERAQNLDDDLDTLTAELGSFL